MKIRFNNETIDLNNLELIGAGEDGKLYLYKDKIIKLAESQDMTLEKMEDFKRVKEKCFSSEKEFNNSQIVLPNEIIKRPNERIKRLRVTPIFGYSQQYHLERKNEIFNIPSNHLINEMETIRSEIHRILTDNKIAIIDTNPNNLLLSDDNKIYFIDRDRDITDSCMEMEKRVIYDKSHYKHNEKRYSILFKNLLLLKLSKCIGGKQGLNEQTFMDYYNKIMDLKLDDAYKIIESYENLSVFTEDRKKELLKKRKRSK